MKRIWIALFVMLAMGLSGAAEAGKKKSKKAKNTPVASVEETKAVEVASLLGYWEAQYSDEQKRMLDIMIRALEGPDFTDEEFEALELSDDDKMYIAMMQMVRNMDSDSAEKQNFQTQIDAMKKTPVLHFLEDRLEVSLGLENRKMTYTLAKNEKGELELVTTLEGSEESDTSIIELVNSDTMLMKGPDGQAMTLIRRQGEPDQEAPEQDAGAPEASEGASEESGEECVDVEADCVQEE